MTMQTSPSSCEGGLPTSHRQGSRVYWYVALIGSLYLFLCYFFIAKVLPIFATLFEGLGVDLPLPTRVLITGRSWFFPVVFVVVALLAAARKFLQLDRFQLRIFDGILIFLCLTILPLAILVLYLPLFDLIRKLSGAH
jgi:hypothetical protein